MSINSAKEKIKKDKDREKEDVIIFYSQFKIVSAAGRQSKQ